MTVFGEIYNLSLEEITALIEKYNQKPFRAKQLYNWLHTNCILDYSEISNLPKSLIENLVRDYPLYKPEIVDLQVANDRTKKFLIELFDKNHVECVAIPSSKEDRFTACISSQVGCPIGCKFCATGKQGFIRNLTSSEIVNQVVLMQKEINSRFSNIVVMGQGEPFLNFNNTITSIRRLNNDSGFNIAARKITVSTSGIIKGIEKFSELKEQFGLSVSLHSSIQSKRNVIMPNLANQPLELLSEALRQYSQKTNRRITFEYLLLKDFNDQEEDLLSLIDFCKDFLCHINLLNFNEIEECEFKSSDKKKIAHFQEILIKNNIPCTIRDSKGSDINGACGQLKNSFNHS